MQLPAPIARWRCLAFRYALQMRIVYFLLTFTFILTSCTEYLNEQEESFMPYEPGQQLIFINSEDSSTDTIFISNIRKYVPDGEQIYFYEHITAYNRKGNEILSVASGHLKYSEPYIRIQGFAGGKQFLKYIADKPRLSLVTPMSTFDDVVILEAPEVDRRTNGTNKIYWSESTGIVQFENGDGSIWELLKIEQTEQE